MTGLDLMPLLRSTLTQPEAVSAAIESVGATLGVSDVVLYLVDFGQTVLEPLGDHTAHNELPHAEEVASTMAGRAFLTQAPVTAERPEGIRLWVPVFEDQTAAGYWRSPFPTATPKGSRRARRSAFLRVPPDGERPRERHLQPPPPT